MAKIFLHRTSFGPELPAYETPQCRAHPDLSPVLSRSVGGPWLLACPRCHGWSSLDALTEWPAFPDRLPL